jgi:thymidylate synthase (FAD)
MYVELVQSNASDEMIARSAWVSNIGEESKTKDTSEIQGLINFLWRNQHHSPFEHGQYTFFIQCPIFVAREFHRHRTFSFNEVSGRYSEMKPHFYVPHYTRPIVQKGKIGNYEFVPETNLAFMADRAGREVIEKAWNQYTFQKEIGIANEVARMVLPLSLYTSFYATVNPRNLAHFLDLRCDKQALLEIREVANQMNAIFEKQQPLFYNAWERYRPVYTERTEESVLA